MSARRLAARVPSAVVDCVASVRGYAMAYRKEGRDGSAKCGLWESRGADDVVWGVLYDIHPSQRAALDRVEGLGWGYEIRELALTGPGGLAIDAFTYYPTRITDDLKPYAWYVEHVLRGAREHGLPSDYIAAVVDVEHMADPDPDRHARELSIYAR